MIELGKDFEEYYQRIKDDFYNTLKTSGLDKLELPKLLIEVTEIELLSDAKMFWEMNLNLDRQIKSLEKINAAGAQLLEGYQPNKSYLDDNNPPSKP